MLPTIALQVTFLIASFTSEIDLGVRNHVDGICAAS